MCKHFVLKLVLVLEFLRLFDIRINHALVIISNFYEQTMEKINIEFNFSQNLMMCFSV